MQTSSAPRVFISLDLFLMHSASRLEISRRDAGRDRQAVLKVHRGPWAPGSRGDGGLGDAKRSAFMSPEELARPLVDTRAVVESIERNFERRCNTCWLMNEIVSIKKRRFGRPHVLLDSER